MCEYALRCGVCSLLLGGLGNIIHLVPILTIIHLVSILSIIHLVPILSIIHLVPILSSIHLIPILSTYRTRATAVVGVGFVGITARRKEQHARQVVLGKTANVGLPRI